MSQYFDNDKNIKSERKIIKFNFDNKVFSIYSDNGVFSKDRFDYGTRVLLSSIDIDSLSGNVLDLGCGLGVVGIILGTINKNINIDMIDINDRALSLVRDNLTLNKVKANVFSSDVYSNVNKKYDYIITNPPIRAGKNVIRGFLLGSYDYLKDDGILYFVMRKDHGVKSMIKELESKYIVNVIGIKGRIETSIYEKDDGEKVKRTSVVADRVSFLSSKTKEIKDSEPEME
mgnify:CR=1 FL=1